MLSDCVIYCACHAQYITQSDNTYTALSNTHLGAVCKISTNCVSCVVMHVTAFCLGGPFFPDTVYISIMIIAITMRVINDILFATISALLSCCRHVNTDVKNGAVFCNEKNENLYSPRTIDNKVRRKAEHHLTITQILVIVIMCHLLM